MSCTLKETTSQFASTQVTLKLFKDIVINKSSIKILTADVNRLSMDITQGKSTWLSHNKNKDKISVHFRGTKLEKSQKVNETNENLWRI